jgi:hypothetical protein
MPAKALDLRMRVSGSFNATNSDSVVYFRTHYDLVEGLMSSGKISESLMPTSVFDGMRFVNVIAGVSLDTTTELKAAMDSYLAVTPGSYRGLFFTTSATVTLTCNAGHTLRPPGVTTPLNGSGSYELTAGDIVTCVNTTGTEFVVTANDHPLASGSVNGLMTSTHWTKLEGLVSNASHTGDVTGSTALTIANGAVTLAKMANLAANSIMGNNTAGALAPKALTKTEVLSFLNVQDGASPNATHTGDVTGATALTIANSAVTLAKMADLAANSIMGNNTAGAIAPKALTKSEVLTFLNVQDGASPNATHTGDVTGATALTITNGAVTLTKMAALGAYTMIGNHSGGSATPVALSTTQVRTLLNVADGATANTKASSGDVTTGTDDNNFLTVARGKQLNDFFSGLKVYGTIAADLTTANAAHPDGAIVAFTAA